jgi:hypothetical protein
MELGDGEMGWGKWRRKRGNRVQVTFSKDKRQQ